MKTCRISELYANSRSGEHATCIRLLTRVRNGKRVGNGKRVRNEKQVQGPARASSARLDKLNHFPNGAIAQLLSACHETY
jgi:hypothetical protein